MTNFSKKFCKKSPFKNDVEKMAKKQGKKYGDPGKDTFGLKYVSAKDQVDSGYGGFIYKNTAYESKQEMMKAILKDNPKSKAAINYFKKNKK